MMTLNDLNGYLDDEAYTIRVGELRNLLAASIAPRADLRVTQSDSQNSARADADTAGAKPVAYIQDDDLEDLENGCGVIATPFRRHDSDIALFSPRPSPVSAEQKFPKGLIRDLLTASDLLSKEWRARNAEVGKRLYGYAEELSANTPAPPAPSVADAAGAKPMCDQCGDSIEAHNPGICGTCHSFNAAGASERADADTAGASEDDARDAKRYRWWTNWVFRAGCDGLPGCAYLADVEEPVDIDLAIDAAILAANKEKP